jgi:hypothetical protein
VGPGDIVRRIKLESSEDLIVSLGHVYVVSTYTCRGRAHAELVRVQSVLMGLDRFADYLFLDGSIIIMR